VTFYLSLISSSAGMLHSLLYTKYSLISSSAVPLGPSDTRVPFELHYINLVVVNDLSASVIGPYNIVLVTLSQVTFIILLTYGACLAVWLALAYWPHITVVITFDTKGN
jgi:hypothetical protein